MIDNAFIYLSTTLTCLVFSITFETSKKKERESG
jgi:hypothetical protein